MNKQLLVAVLALVCLASAVSCQNLVQYTQTLPPDMDSLEGNGFINDPFATGGSQRWQWVYDSSYFKVQRPVIINAIAFRPDGGAGLSAFDFPLVQVRMSSATANYNALSTTSLNSNMASNLVMVRNPLSWTSGSVPAQCGSGAWVNLLLGQSFFYDPALGQDLVIDIEICSTITPWSASIDAMNGPVMGARYGNTTSCTANSGVTNTDVPIMRVNYLTTPQWQRNTPNCTLDLNGLPANQFGPTQLNTTVGTVNYLRLQSSLVTMGWEFASSLAPAVSAAQGALTTPAGQLVNINLAAGGIFLFNNLSFPPWPGSFALPISFPAPLSIGSQMHIFDFTHPDFSRLSAMGRITVSPGLASLGAPVPGPTADDASVAVPIGGFAFFNQVYTQIHISSNGRIVFGGADADPASELATEFCSDNPFVGYWADLDPASGGTITASSPSSQTIRVEYAGVPYSGQSTAITSTFAIILNGFDNSITLEGIDGVAMHPAATPTAGDNGWLGISGGLGIATDAGQTAFSVTGPIGGASRTDAIYGWGLSGTLAPSLTSLRFDPNYNPVAAPNFTWTGL